MDVVLAGMQVDHLVVPARKFDWADPRLPESVKRRILYWVLCVDQIHLQPDGQYCYDEDENNKFADTQHFNVRVLGASPDIYHLGREIFWERNKFQFVLGNDFYSDHLQFITKGQYHEFEVEDLPHLKPFTPGAHIDHVKFGKRQDVMFLGNPRCVWAPERKYSSPNELYCGQHDSSEGNLALEFKVLEELHKHHILEGRSFAEVDLTFTGLDLSLYECTRHKKISGGRLNDNMSMIRAALARMTRMSGGRSVESAERLILRDSPHGVIGFQIVEMFNDFAKGASVFRVTDSHNCELRTVNGHMLPPNQSRPFTSFKFGELPKEITALIIKKLMVGSYSYPKQIGNAAETNNRHGTGRSCTPILDLLTSCKLIYHLATKDLHTKCVIQVKEPQMGVVMPWMLQEMTLLNEDFDDEGKPRNELVRYIHLPMSSPYPHAVTEQAFKNCAIQQGLTKLGMQLKMLSFEVNQHAMPLVVSVCGTILKSWLLPAGKRPKKVVSERGVSDCGKWPYWTASRPKTSKKPGTAVIPLTIKERGTGIQIDAIRFVGFGLDHTSKWSARDFEWLLRSVVENICDRFARFEWVELTKFWTEAIEKRFKEGKLVGTVSEMDRLEMLMRAEQFILT